MAGPYPGALSPAIADTKLRALLAAGIDYFIDLTEVGEGRHFGRPLVPYREHLMELVAESGLAAEHCRWPIPDMDIPDDEQMIAILDDIDQARGKGHHIYVHCLGGVGRTGTVVGCWLARHGIAQGEEAIGSIARLRNYVPGRDMNSPQTKEQFAMVRRWEQGM